jgi:hypothetical protein
LVSSLVVAWACSALSGATWAVAIEAIRLEAIKAPSATRCVDDRTGFALLYSSAMGEVRSVFNC